jgi:glycogen debranching enzyme
VHDQVICVAVPKFAVSGADGQIRDTGAQGMYHGDFRTVSTLLVRVEGREPEAIGHVLPGSGRARFVGIVRRAEDPTADPVIVVERLRDVAAGTERVTLRNYGPDRADIDLEVELAADFAHIANVKRGIRAASVAPDVAGGALTFSASPGATVRVECSPPPERVAGGRLHWPVRIAPGRSWAVVLRWNAHAQAPSPVAAADAAPWVRPEVRCDDHRVAELLRQSLADLEALLGADTDEHADVFVTAGAPWYVTLFGRDALWTARMLLPLGRELAGGTLRALARRQGVRTDPETDEEPGKVPHEVRIPGGGLPAISYGSVDATALFLCLLVDAWRWGLPLDQVRDLLPAAERAMGWLRGHGDGFVCYRRNAPGGLSNQGWKDSADAIRLADGRQAEPPIALPEVQAYAYEAAIGCAALFEAFDIPRATETRRWAEALQARFRSAFVVADGNGPYVALALDGAGRPVTSVASNMGHVLGTGLLDEHLSAAIADRLCSPDLDSGWGLRTLSAEHRAFNPLGYHTGSVWPHDTAITAWSLSRAGHTSAALSLLRGIVDAAPHFGYRLPELYSGERRAPGLAPVAYPAACRPQAWAGAAAVVLLTVLTGLDPDVPRGTIRVCPAPSGFGLREVSGLPFGSGHLSMQVSDVGEPAVENTTGLNVVASA